MGPSAAWFYEGQLRLHRNWKLEAIKLYSSVMICLVWFFLPLCSSRFVQNFYVCWASNKYRTDDCVFTFYFLVSVLCVAVVSRFHVAVRSARNDGLKRLDGDLSCWQRLRV